VGEGLTAKASMVTSVNMDACSQKLSPDLRALYEDALATGNVVVRVDEPAGTLCPLAIVFGKPLIRSADGTPRALPPGVRWWENDDSHYEIQAGWQSETSRHILAAPLSSVPRRL